jgi:peptidoglycan hydrolase-like protein with peptidoglycan-binding domain
MATVGEIVRLRGCTTAPVKGLSEQIIDEINLLIPNVLVSIDDLNVSGNDATVNLYLQPKAKEALKRAINRRGVTLRLTSAYRTVVQQHLLFSWLGSCGITDAAKPGRSNHEDGTAIDTPDFGAWKTALETEGWDWFGDESRDVVHFDFERGGVRNDIGDIGVKAFQILWNKNNPNDKILEDGDYGQETAARLNRSPANGFGQTRNLKVSNPPMQGEDVRKVQQALVKLDLLEADQIDSIYNQATKLAVETFQRREGLSVDGIVGRQTRRSLGIN